MKDVKDILFEMVDQITVVSVGSKKPYAISESVDNAIKEAEAELNQHYYQLMLEVIGGDIPSDFDHDAGFCQNCDFEPTDGTENCICKIVTEARRKQRQQAKKLLGKESDE